MKNLSRIGAPFILLALLAIYFLNEGLIIPAVLVFLPVVAFILFLVSPFQGPGHFAFNHEFGPIREKCKTEKDYHLKLARWWFMGSLILPVSFGLAHLFSQYKGFSVSVSLLGYVLGIPFIIKGLGSLYNAYKLHR